MSAKPGLSRERHRAIGLRLAEIDRELCAIDDAISKAYPVKALDRAIQKLREARLALENAAAVRDGVEGDECVRLYWPSRAEAGAEA